MVSPPMWTFHPAPFITARSEWPVPTVMVSCWVEDGPTIPPALLFQGVTCMVKAYVPAWVGVPSMVQ